jgi:hypothetical protein
MDYGQHSIPSPSPSPGLISCREPSVDLGSDRTVIPDGPSVELAEIDNELERKKKTWRSELFPERTLTFLF